MSRACLALAFALAALPACYSDTAPEPEPRLEQPGAFVAVDRGDGPLELFRTLSALTVNDDTILFVTIYDVDPETWDEAREIAKGHDIRMREVLTFLSRKLVVEDPYEVVWFRTLTEEEEARVP